MRTSLALAFLLLAGRAAPGFSQSTLFSEWGDGSGDKLGFSVSILGDVNGDGIPDFAAGAPAGEVGYEPLPAHPGFARVFSGADGASLFTIPSFSTVHFFAASMAPAGDADGDGLADLLVAIRVTNSAARGYAVVYSGLDGHAIRGYASGLGRDSFGYDVANCGDVDADGFPDHLVGAPFADGGVSNGGGAYLYSGKDGTLLRTFFGTQALAFFGAGVSGAGDVDVDGFDDVLVGAYFHKSHGGAATGEVTIFSGKDGAILRVIDGFNAITGANGLTNFGESVSRAGDLDGDGVEDQVVGAPYPGSIAGAVYAYSGATGSLLFKFSAGQGADRLGRSITPAGDVNQDGFADLAVGAPFSESGLALAGRVYLLAGPNGHVIETIVGGPDDHLGNSVAGGIDLNGDGKLELAAGAPWNSLNGNHAGVAKVLTIP